MAQVMLLVACGLGAWGTAFALLGMGRRGAGRVGAGPGDVGHSRDGSLGQRLARRLEVAGTWEPFGEVAAWDDAKPLLDEVRDLAGSRGLALSRRAAAAVLAMVAVGAGILLAVLLGGAVWAVGPVIVLLVLVPVAGEVRGRRRHNEVAAAMPQVFRSLAGAMEAGQTLSQSVEYVGSHERGPVAEPFVRTALRLRCGMPSSEALDVLAEELDAPGSQLLVTALTVSQRTGSPLRSLFLRSAVLVERQAEFQRLLRVKTAQVRLSARIVCSMPVVMIFLLGLVSPDFRRGLASPLGMGSVVAAVMLDAVALLVMRRLMRGWR